MALLCQCKQLNYLGLSENVKKLRWDYSDNGYFHLVSGFPKMYENKQIHT